MNVYTVAISGVTQPAIGAETIDEALAHVVASVEQRPASTGPQWVGVYVQASDGQYRETLAKNQNPPARSRMGSRVWR